ncbi:tubulin delta chain isoform X1 [Gopherus flavomarginatus]|uniref:tubulin delta chain isoform X1 n=2 Tax=Gopherus flavomarginatus TaxID=286002 RepID=UPI0021CBDFEF|nr:tubulin delta chain isoform X1 [Gopherus flavomarginatus]XP_050784767.1 tubulin delta chain isoform X1 [Gopherus flavomarginatus]XP_050784769.1 tubulin delta chain isoform X1 [Gopherus flavomarginatus]
MSIVTVQLGQCGNQIGYEVFNAICNDFHSTHGLCSKKENESYQEACKERFFSEEKTGVPVARAVLVDMEPKVISQTLSIAARSGHWKYDHQSHFCQKQGSGNNWANGYSVHGPRYRDVIMNLVQKEAEKCDRLSGFFTVMSMAGGTGSGMGAFVTQCLRDAFPTSFILNQVIWPYGTGEVIVQNYNSVLTLSHLYQSADALLVHENDAIHKICAQLMNIKKISFRDVNQVIAHQLGSVFQPTYSSEGASQYSRSPLGDLMESLVPHPEFKMLGLRNIPQMSENSLTYSTFTWPGLIKHLRQMLIANAKMEEGIDWQVRPPLPGHPVPPKASPNKALHFNTSIANLVVLRGKDVQSVDLGGFRDPALYTSWLNPQEVFKIWKTPRAFNKYEKSASLVSNSQFLLKLMDNIVGKAWNMFASRAYVHQYTKFGIEEEDFLDCFTTLEQVLSSYASL